MPRTSHIRIKNRLKPQVVAQGSRLASSLQDTVKLQASFKTPSSSRPRKNQDLGGRLAKIKTSRPASRSFQVQDSSLQVQDLKLQGPFLFKPAQESRPQWETVNNQDLKTRVKIQDRTTSRSRFSKGKIPLQDHFKIKIRKTRLKTAQVSKPQWETVKDQDVKTRFNIKILGTQDSRGLQETVKTQELKTRGFKKTSSSRCKSRLKTSSRSSGQRKKQDLHQDGFLKTAQDSKPQWETVKTFLRSSSATIKICIKASRTSRHEHRWGILR
ncbi:hypothetical protein DFH09DRAFT_1272367 [Mycena vulgaris]|nr:hypothetical protein DFH09DRAFT_1272367 [Mycena vulgaris]